MKTLNIFRSKVPALIAVLLSLSLTSSLFAKKKQPAPQVELTATGKQLEANYTKQMNALKKELLTYLSAVDDKKKAYYLKALDAYSAAEKNLSNTSNSKDMVKKAQGLVNHAKGKWIGGADHNIRRVQAQLKKAKSAAEKKKYQKELEKWQKNRADGVKELQKRQAMLDKALNDQANYQKNVTIAKAKLIKAKSALEAAAKKCGLFTVLNSNKLDYKMANFVIINEASPRGLAEFGQKSSSNAALIDKLLSSNELMLTMLTADGAQRPRVGRGFGNAQWGNAMKIYSDIRNASSKSKEGVYNRLAIAVSLAHAAPIKQSNPKAATTAPEFVNPVKRYLHYEKAYVGGELDPCFKNLSIWEMRMVVNGDEPDDILTWGRETMRNYRPDHITTSSQGWRYVRIISSDVNYGSGDVKYDSPELQQYQNILMNGGVCGRRAFFGRFILRAFGVPTIARPSRGHAALARFTPEGWTVCLGGGWGAGWTKTQYTSDKDFLASTQARKNRDAFIQVKRAQWAGDVIGEKRVFGENDKTKPGFWNGLAIKTQRGIIQSLNATELKALGANIGEADGNSGVEKGMNAKVSAADKKITYSNGTIMIPAAAYKTSGTKGVSTMKSFNGGLQIFLPRFAREGTSLLRGGSWKGDANALSSPWRLKSGGYGAYENWGFRVALTHKGGNAPKEISLEIAPGVKMQFVYIKPGSFTMGGDSKVDSKWNGVEAPKHAVQITKGFYLGKYEVTQAQFQAIMGQNKSRSSKGPDFPADNVTWDDSLKFCKDVSFKTKREVRLPTEAEWEYAARAGSSSKWFFGNNPAKMNDYAWSASNSGKKSHKVGLKKPNPWGLYDIYGNVVERVADVYDKNYYARSPKKDPVGPGQGANTYFEYEINAASSGTYDLTALVVTNKHSQELSYSVNGGDMTTSFLPFTIGAWKETKPMKVTLKKGKNTLRFSRQIAPQKGVAVKSFTLKPAK